MYCSKCGKKVVDTDAFCGSCGNQLKEDGTNQAKVEKRLIDGQIKEFGIVILYTGLILAFGIFSRTKMFVFAFDESTIIQFMDKMLLLSDASYELSGLENLFHICLWIFRIGLFVYLGAMIFFFVNRRRVARVCSVAGFICNIITIIIVLFSVFVYADEFGMFYRGSDYAFEFFARFIKESFYIYIVLNIALLICGFCVPDTDENIEMKLSEKDKILLEMAAEHRAKENGWICGKCGERNEGFAVICRICGSSKK